jgi:hypothetical protein
LCPKANANQTFNNPNQQSVDKNWKKKNSRLEGFTQSVQFTWLNTKREEMQSLFESFFVQLSNHLADKN